MHLRYASDPRRIYASGFSGGGMLAYELGRSTDSLAGVIASGARWESQHFKHRIEFASFGAAGDTDFNYSEMKAVHARLREWGTPEWLLVFEGRHQWMPVGVASEAVAWMELLAMKRGLRLVDPGFVAERLKRGPGAGPGARGGGTTARRAPALRQRRGHARGPRGRRRGPPRGRPPVVARRHEGRAA